MEVFLRHRTCTRTTVGFFVADTVECGEGALKKAYDICAVSWKRRRFLPRREARVARLHSTHRRHHFHEGRGIHDFKNNLGNLESQ